MTGTLTPLTIDEWNSLSPKAKWDTIVALRGPDMPNSEAIKWFSTSVIRGRLRDCMRVGGAINPDLNLVIVPSSPLEWGDVLQETRRELRGRLWDYGHFFQHIEEAAMWIGIPVLKLSSYWPSIESGGGIRVASERFLRELIEAPRGYGWKSQRDELTRHVKDYLAVQYGWKYGSFQPSITDLPGGQPAPSKSKPDSMKGWASIPAAPPSLSSWEPDPSEEEVG